MLLSGLTSNISKITPFGIVIAQTFYFVFSINTDVEQMNLDDYAFN